MRIYAWTYEADIHCADCAQKRFTQEQLDDPETEDSERNPIHPVYGWEFEETTFCGDCHALIMEVAVEEDDIWEEEDEV